MFNNVHGSIRSEILLELTLVKIQLLLLKNIDMLKSVLEKVA